MMKKRLQRELFELMLNVYDRDEIYISDIMDSESLKNKLDALDFRMSCYMYDTTNENLVELYELLASIEIEIAIRRELVGIKPKSVIRYIKHVVLKKLWWF